jgi:calcium-dependent protein kinase
VMNKKGNVQDSYEILQSLGRGSFGSVSRVRDRKTGLEKAMKEVIKLQVPSQQLALILNEIEILKGLDHPNIMKLFEIIESPKCYYIICEYLQGGDLFNLLKRKKTFTEEKSKKLMFDLLSGLNYLHSNKIVHLDLKLENLVLTNESPDSKLKIVDFGVSRRMTSSPFSGKIGSVISNQANYLAPEVLSGDFNEKVDIWCAGVILYMMISGSFPFKYDTDEKYLARIQNEVLSFDKKAWSKVSDSCIDLLRKMLNPNKDKRISALRALKHPWLKTEADNSLMSIQTSYCDNLRSFKVIQK